MQRAHATILWQHLIGRFEDVVDIDIGQFLDAPPEQRVLAEQLLIGVQQLTVLCFEGGNPLAQGGSCHRRDFTP